MLPRAAPLAPGIARVTTYQVVTPAAPGAADQTPTITRTTVSHADLGQRARDARRDLNRCEDTSCASNKPGADTTMVIAGGSMVCTECGLVKSHNCDLGFTADVRGADAMEEQADANRAQSAAVSRGEIARHNMQLEKRVREQEAKSNASHCSLIKRKAMWDSKEAVAKEMTAERTERLLAIADAENNARRAASCAALFATWQPQQAFEQLRDASSSPASQEAIIEQQAAIEASVELPAANSNDDDDDGIEWEPDDIELELDDDAIDDLEAGLEVASDDEPASKRVCLPDIQDSYEFKRRARAKYLESKVKHPVTSESVTLHEFNVASMQITRGINPKSEQRLRQSASQTFHGLLWAMHTILRISPASCTMNAHTAWHDLTCDYILAYRRIRQVGSNEDKTERGIPHVEQTTANAMIIASWRTETPINWHTLRGAFNDCMTSETGPLSSRSRKSIDAFRPQTTLHFDKSLDELVSALSERDDPHPDVDLRLRRLVVPERRIMVELFGRLFLRQLLPANEAQRQVVRLMAQIKHAFDTADMVKLLEFPAGTIASACLLVSLKPGLRMTPELLTCGLPQQKYKSNADLVRRRPEIIRGGGSMIKVYAPDVVRATLQPSPHTAKCTKLFTRKLM